VLVPENNFLKSPDSEKRRVAIFGSTGSIGVSALEVIRANPESLEVFSLAAGSNTGKLAEQISEFKPEFAVIGDESKLKTLREEVAGRSPATKLLAGERSLIELAAHPDYGVMLAAIVGFQGLPSVLSAIKENKHIALANKESLVAAGSLIKSMLADSQAVLLPVDSEHSALFQVLQGENPKTLNRLILTASGGPFLHASPGELDAVTPAQAMKHPKWSMGPKISIDSATLMNKALELIEAFWLFNCESDKLDVLVHPQSIVHSIAEFVDGTQLAQLSVPDMKGPISFALNYPNNRLPNVMRALKLEEVGRLDFYALDHARFPAIRLAREALRCGGATPAVFNIANEVAVDLFIQRRISFPGIMRLIEESLERHSSHNYQSEEELYSLMVEVKKDIIDRN